MANINTFSDDGTRRIVRTVRQVERSPLNTPTYRRKSRSRASGATEAQSVFPCVVTSVSNTSVFAVKLTNQTGTPFLVAALSYQDTNLSIGNVIMAAEHVAITL